jgi:hypothetical protein
MRAKQGFKDKISQFDLATLKFMAVVLCLVIFGLGIWSGISFYLLFTRDSNFNHTIFIQVVFAVLIDIFIIKFFSFFFKNYVAGKLENAKVDYDSQLLKERDKYRAQLAEVKDEYEKKIEIFQNVYHHNFLIEKSYYSAYIVTLPERRLDEYRSEESRFIANVPPIDMEIPEDFNEGRIHLLLQHMISAISTDEREKCFDLEARSQALKGLAKGFSGPPDDRPFNHLVGQACNHALGLGNETRELRWALPFYQDIEIYLRAWLVCSIGSGIPIPVEPFVQHSLGEEGTGHYYGKNNYIEAIEYFRRVVLSEPRMSAFLSTEDARQIISIYLKQLIALLKVGNSFDSIRFGKYHKVLDYFGSYFEFSSEER